MGKRINLSCGIYRILNLVTLKCYIGYSEGIEKRWDNHKYRLKKGIHDSEHLQNSYNIYGPKNFKYDILEHLPKGLTKLQYEEVETKWVLYYSSHKKESGYNGCMPGSIPLILEDENETKISGKETKPRLNKVIAININTKEVIEFDNGEIAASSLNTTGKQVRKCINYWKDLDKVIYDSTRSSNGWIFVRSKNFNPEFDYTNFNKKIKNSKTIIKKSYKKDPKDIRPYSERNLKRVPIEAVHHITGEIKYFPSIKEASGLFSIPKIYKCLKAEYGKYKHREYFFKYSILEK